MKRLNYLIFSLIIIFSLTACDKHPHQLTPAERTKLIAQSKAKFKVCDPQAIALQISSGQNEYQTKYDTKYMVDKVAGYNYYLVTTQEDVNVDQIRGIVCQYIHANQCYIYWGNIANIAMLSNQKAPWFPGDTTPHYMISPDITCNAIYS